jgi:hypothetical protein
LEEGEGNWKRVDERMLKEYGNWCMYVVWGDIREIGWYMDCKREKNVLEVGGLLRGSNRGEER